MNTVFEADKTPLRSLNWEDIFNYLYFFSKGSLDEQRVGKRRMWTKEEMRKAAEEEIRKTEVWSWECGGDTAGQLGCKFAELGRGRNKNGKC